MIPPNPTKSRSRDVSVPHPGRVRSSHGVEPLESRIAPAALFPEFVDPNPSAGNGFGAFIVPLITGKVVVTSPQADVGGTDTGAVYLYDGATGALISTLVGSRPGDQVGSTGITALTNGNFVVRSANWDNGGVVDAGAVTWGHGMNGVNGAVNPGNSLVGSTTSDQVGITGVSPLGNGHFVVRSAVWDNGGAVDAGAVTWGNGTTGVNGPVSAANSLVGMTASDGVGTTLVTLSNGNYVVGSPSWDNGGLANVGAATWGNGTVGVSGAVSPANSLVGATAGDQVTMASIGVGIAALTNGNYVVRSENWDNGGVVNAGAATWGDGTTGVSGSVSVANSLVGSRLGDFVSSGGIAMLTNGNYVVRSQSWDNGVAAANAGAATWGSGTAGVIGAVSAANSLVGSTANNNVSSNNVLALPNGNYVVLSLGWDDGGTANVGAATWGDGTTGISGVVSAANSLVGTTADDAVGNSSTILSNGNYVLRSPNWDNGPVANAGAVTWGNAATGISGPVSQANSLVGTAAEDQVGNSLVLALTNGNYVVSSSLWDDGPVADVGAVTWGNGVTGSIGAVSTANSLVGSTQSDQLGNSGALTALTNGNYVVRSLNWDNGPVVDAGAVTWGSGAAGVIGTVSPANSLVGSTTSDQVGTGGVAALTNGNYVVRSTNWDNGAIVNAGAATWGNGASGVTGAVSPANSLVGSTANDNVSNTGGIGGIPLPNGNYVVTSANWDNGALVNAGAVTWGSGAAGVTGEVTVANSTLGLVANAGPVAHIVDTTNNNFISRFSGEGKIRVRSMDDGLAAPGGSLAPTLIGGTLTILDTAGVLNNLSVIVTAGNLVITDANEQFASAPAGATLSNGFRTLTIALSAITAGFTFDGAGGDDLLTLDFSGGNVIPNGGILFQAAAQGALGDSLAITGGTTGTVTHSFTNATDGSVTLAGALAGTISYTGVEPITDNLAAADRGFTFNGGAEAISVSDAAGAAMLIDSSVGAPVTFPNPTTSITINAGSGDDTINITSLDAAYTGALTILGDAANDNISLAGGLPNLAALTTNSETLGALPALTLGAGGLHLTTGTGGIILNGAISSAGNSTLDSAAGITFNQSIAMAVNTNLTVNALGTSNGTINFATANADLAASGTGAISLTTVRNILMTTVGASVRTVNGDITMNANQQAVQTSGDFFGVRVDDGLIEASGTGSIAINGRGGIDPAGVFTCGLSFINTPVRTNTGSITMAGVGGQTLGNQNNGLQVHTGGIVESTGGGSIDLTGTGGGGNNAPGTGQVMHGIRVLLGGIVRTTAAGNITLTGTGGAVGSASDNYGVRIDNAGALTSSGFGTITINATGGANNAPAFRTDTGTNRVGFDGVNPYTGAIVINADSMDIANATIQTAGTATLRQKTNTTQINLGAADSGGVLGLTNAELDQVTAGTLQIGDASSGAITVSAAILHANNLTFTTGAGVSGAGALTLAPGKNLGVTASGAINLTGPLVVPGTATFTAGANAITLTNAGNDFGGAVALSNSGTGNVSIVDANALTLGASTVGTGTLAATAGGALTVSGAIGFGGGLNLTVNGADQPLFVQGTLTTACGGNAPANLKATGEVRFESSADLTVGAGALALILNSDSDANNAGGVLIDTGSVLATNGGNVTIGGGASPATTPTGGFDGAFANRGVLIITGGSIDAGAGNVSIQGHGRDGGAGFATAIEIQGSVTTTTGSITFVGTGGNNAVNLGNGVQVQGVVESTAGGSINLNGTAAGTGQANLGIRIFATGTVRTTGAGNITITGTGSATGTNTSNYGVSFASGSTVAIAGSGAIAINANAGANSAAFFMATGTNRIGFDGVTPYSGNITINANSVSLAEHSIVTTSTVTFLPLTASATISLGGAAMLDLTDAELDGVTAGLVQIGNGTGGPITIGAAITHANDLSLTTGAGVTFNQPVTMVVNKSLTATAGATGTVTVGAALTASGTGAIQLTGQDVTGAGTIATDGGLTVSNTGTASTLSNAISGTGSLTKTGSGTLTLSASNSYSGSTVVNGGTLLIDGTLTNTASVAAVTGATLGGIGTIAAPVTTNNGRLAPGGSPGALSTGSVAFNPVSNFDVEINGAALASHDQLNVTGSVTLTGVNLNPTGSITSVPGQQVVLIANDAAEPVSGTFNGLIEGAAVTVNGVTFNITYAGGTDNNDVVLVQPAPPVIETELTLVAGDLVITDIAAGGHSGTLTLQPQPGNGLYLITDPNRNLAATGIPGANVSPDLHTVTVPFAAVTGTQILVNSLAGDDTLTVDLALGPLAKTLSFDGGTHAGEGDKLSVTGPAVTTATFAFINAQAGGITLAGSSGITYTGLEGVDTSIPSTNLTLNYDASAPNTITVTDGGGGKTTVAATEGATLKVVNPSGTLTVNGGSGGDTFNLDSLSNFAGALTFDGKVGTDAVNLAAGLPTMAGLTVVAETIAALPALTIGAGGLAITATAGAITQVGALNVTGLASFDAGANAITLTNAANAFGTVSIGGGGTVSLLDDSGFELGAANVSTLLSVESAGAITQSAPITGTGGLTKLGLGTLTLSAANTYTGPTNVNTGTLLVNGSLADGAAATDVTVAPGATLGGTGTINGSVANSGTVQPGGTGAAGTITITGAYSQGAGGTLAAELGGTGAGQFDVLNVGATATLDGTLNATVLGGFTPPLNSTYQILAAGTRSGTFATTNVPPGFVALFPGAAVLLAAPLDPLLVTTTADVVNAGDALTSLREAITFANGNAGLDTITFAIPGGGVQTIVPTSALPTITSALVIDGYSQPGSSVNTATAGSNAVPLIVLNGATAGASSNGLTLTAGGSTIRGLVINGFTAHGIRLTGATADGNVIEGNFIGTNASGGAGPGITGAAVFIDAGAGANLIGGTTLASRNILSNSLQGVFITGAGSGGNTIHGNLIGTNAAGTAGLPNASGIHTQSPGTIIGGAGANEGNVLSGNNFKGIHIDGPAGARSAVILGNLIGTTAAGTGDLGNNEVGILIDSAVGTTIGGAAAGSRNVISGNNGDGIRLQGIASTNAVIRGNRIGTNAAGTLAIGNSGAGIAVVGVPGVAIGGSAAGEGNLISGNGSRGIDLSGAATTGTQIQGNFIGTNAAGTAALGNVSFGVWGNGSSTATIGGTAAGAGNLISGNSEGVHIDGDGNVVQGNLIGTDVTGLLPLGNTAYGIVIATNSNNNLIGGTAAGARNVVSANGASGIAIFGSTVTATQIEGNAIGTDLAGTLALGNGAEGILISSGVNTTIGGTGAGAGNVIAFNVGDGVRVESAPATGNSIRGNSIFSNAELGINLAGGAGENAAGVTPNDALDADTGANGLLNFPVLASAVSSALTATIAGTLHSAGSGTFLVDFYASATVDPSGFGEGQIYLGSTTATTNAAGDATFNFTTTTLPPAGGVITATATDLSGNTSEFSAIAALAVGFVWDAGGGADTSWFNPLNWDRDLGSPTPTDTATLNINATITLGADATVAAFQQSAGTLGGAGTLTSASDFDVRGGTIAAGLAGNVGLTKTTAGTVTLSGINTYTGLTIVSAGTLELTSTASGANGPFSLGGGTLMYNFPTPSEVLTPAVMPTADSSIGVAAGKVVTLAGVLSGPGGLTKVGAGTLALGNALNTFGPAAVTIDGGTLQVATDGALGEVTNQIIFNNGTLKTTGSFASARKIVQNGTAILDVATGTALTLIGPIDDPTALQNNRIGLGALQFGFVFVDELPVLPGNPVIISGTSVAATGGATVKVHTVGGLGIQIDTIALTNTTSTTSLTIKGPGTINRIVSDGDLGSLVLGTGVVLGNGVRDSVPELEITGKATKLQLYDLAAYAYIDLGAELPYEVLRPNSTKIDTTKSQTKTNRPNLTIHKATGPGVLIDVTGDGMAGGIGGGGLGKVIVDEWNSTGIPGAIRTTQSIGSFKLTRGDSTVVFEVDKFHLGSSTTAAIGSMTIQNGSWGSSGSEIEGNVGSFNANAFLASATLTAGSMGKFTLDAGAFAGLLTLTDPDAAGIPTFTVVGNFSGSVVSKSPLKKINVKGDFTGELEAPFIGSITAYAFLGTNEPGEYNAITATEGSLGTLTATNGVVRNFSIVTDQVFKGFNIKLSKLMDDTIGIDNVHIQALSIGNISVSLAASPTAPAGIDLVGILDSDFITTGNGATKATLGSIGNITVTLTGVAGGNSATGIVNSTFDALVEANEFPGNPAASTVNALGRIAVKITGQDGPSLGLDNVEFLGNSIGATAVSVSRGTAVTSLASAIDLADYTATGAIGAMTIDGDATSTQVTGLNVWAGANVGAITVKAKTPAHGTIADSSILAGQALDVSPGTSPVLLARLAKATLGAVNVSGSITYTDLIAGASIGAVTVGGSLTDSLILAGALLGDDLALGGSGANIDIFQRAAAIAAVTVKGASGGIFARTSIIAGVSPGNGIFGDSGDAVGIILGALPNMSSIGVISLPAGVLASVTGSQQYGIEAAKITSLKLGLAAAVPITATKLLDLSGGDDVLVKLIA